MDDVSPEGLDDDLRDLSSFSLALDENRRWKCFVFFGRPDPDIDSAIVASRPKDDVKAFAIKVLGDQSLELPPVDLVDIVEIAIQVVDQALIEELPVVRRERLAVKELL